MDVQEFAKKLEEGLDKIPDSDGEPGYFADVTTTCGGMLGEGVAILNVTTLPDDVRPEEEEFVVIITKKR